MLGLQIGDVAERSGVPATTIRYYESIGLRARPSRSATGYRRYADTTVEELQFIRKAQTLGFSLEEVAEILKLSRAGKAPCTRVLDLANRHLEAVDARIEQLSRFRELAGEIVKGDGRRQPTCEGLCEIISCASDVVPRDIQPRPLKRAGHNRETNVNEEDA